MFRPIGLCLKVLSFAVLLMFVARPSYASLVGSEVYCENSSHWVCTPAIAVVGEGVEFRLVSPFSGDAAFAIDIDEDGVQFKHLRTRPSGRQCRQGR